MPCDEFPIVAPAMREMPRSVRFPPVECSAGTRPSHAAMSRALRIVDHRRPPRETQFSFGPLHALFQTIHEDRFVAQDDLAERIKALDAHAEGTLSGMLKRSKIAEVDGTPKAEEMIRLLKDAQETPAETLAGAGELAARHGDALTGTRPARASASKKPDRFYQVLETASPDDSPHPTGEGPGLSQTTGPTRPRLKPCQRSRRVSSHLAPPFSLPWARCRPRPRKGPMSPSS